MTYTCSFEATFGSPFLSFWTSKSLLFGYLTATSPEFERP